MSMGKKSNEATKKKGMALSDAALDDVAGGVWIVWYGKNGQWYHKNCTTKTYAKIFAKKRKKEGYSVDPIKWSFYRAT